MAMKPGTPPSKLQNELKQPGMGGEPAPPTTKEAAADQLRRILETTTLGQLWAHRAAERGPIVKEPVHQVTTQDSVDTVMELMAKQRLSAVPVFNATKKKYVGFVDRLDLATFVLDRLSGNDNPQPAEIDYIAKSCSAERVENVVDFSHWDPLVMVKEDVPISAVLKHLADGVHRVALYDEDESVMTGVISQRMVVRWLLPLVDKFEPLFSQTLQQLGQLGMGDVLTVKDSESALMALKRLTLFRVTGAAVTNDNGQVVESFSSTDLNGVVVQPFGNLVKPVVEFLKPVRERSMPVPIRGPICCSTKAPLSEVMTLIATCHIHRVWLVDDERRPVGCVTCTDILDALVSRV